jgi:hypothetical protein
MIHEWKQWDRLHLEEAIANKSDTEYALTNITGLINSIWNLFCLPGETRNQAAHMCKRATFTL